MQGGRTRLQPSAALPIDTHPRPPLEGCWLHAPEPLSTWAPGGSLSSATFQPVQEAMFGKVKSGTPCQAQDPAGSLVLTSSRKPALTTADVS